MSTAEDYPNKPAKDSQVSTSSRKSKQVQFSMWRSNSVCPFKSTFCYIYYIKYWPTCFNHHDLQPWTTDEVMPLSRTRCSTLQKGSELLPGQQAIIFSWLPAKFACWSLSLWTLFFGLRAYAATHYDNHSGCVAYAPCLLCIVFLRSDTVACMGQGEHRHSWDWRGGVRHLQVRLFPHTFLHILHYKQPCFCRILPFLSNNPVFFIFVNLNDHVFSPV